MTVRAGNLHHRHITGETPGAEKLLRFVQRHRNIIRVARLHLAPDIAADKE